MEKTVEVKVNDLYVLLGLVNIVRKTGCSDRIVLEMYDMLHGYLDATKKEGEHGKE